MPISIMLNYTSQHHVANPQISTQNIGWHIAHSALAIIKIIKSFESSDPAKYQPKRRLVKYIVLWSGWMPRGKAKAPNPSVPKDEIVNSQEQIQQLVNEATDRYQRWINSDHIPNQYFDHMIFGHLDFRYTKRLIHTHTSHHLKIIRDILKS